MKHKLERLIAAAFFAATWLILMSTSVATGDVVGDSYSLGITGFGEQGGGYLTIQNGVTNHVFAGSNAPIVIGDSVFGESDAGGPLDEFVLIEQFNVLSGNQREVIIDVVTRNKSTGQLTNWFADGASTNGAGDPFTESAIEIGDFNGGTDRLNASPFVAPVSSEFNLIGTDGNAYLALSLDTPFDGNGLGGAAGVSLGADLSTFDLGGGVELAGYRVRYVYAVPEPNATLVLMLGLTLMAGTRRR